MVSLLGVVTGLVVYVLATAAGLSVLFRTVPELFLAVRLLGAAYLLWLAAALVRRSTAGMLVAFAVHLGLTRSTT